MLSLQTHKRSPILDGLVTENGKAGSESGRRTRLILVAVLALYVILFIFLNTDRININFVLFSVRARLLVAFALVAVLSFLAGFFVRGRRRSGD